MDSFVFQNATKIIFGKGTESTVGQEVRAFGERALFLYGGGHIRKSGLYDRVKRSLQEAGVTAVELSGVTPNPRLSLVHEGIRLCREKKLDFILAVGGGSVIDTAKAISIGVPYDGDVWDFYLRKATIRSAAPIGVVLTIPAAGSESSNGSVITKEDEKLKRDALSELIRPKFAILNPELTLSLPREQTVYGAVDIMAHIIERYFTPTSSVDFTDRLCEAALNTVKYNLQRVLEVPGDYDARAQIMWAGTIAHNDLLSTGRTGDWASHNIEHELSGMYDVAHGAGLAVVLPAWMRYVCTHDVSRFARFAVTVWGVEASFVSPERTAAEGIRRMKTFFHEVGLPTTLTELGVPADRLDAMARLCTERGSVGNLVKLGREDVLAILRLAV